MHVLYGFAVLLYVLVCSKFAGSIMASLTNLTNILTLHSGNKTISPRMIMSSIFIGVMDWISFTLTGNR